jgi:hypothetical protein
MVKWSITKKYADVGGFLSLVFSCTNNLTVGNLKTLEVHEINALHNTSDNLHFSFPTSLPGPSQGTRRFNNIPIKNLLS